MFKTIFFQSKSKKAFTLIEILITIAVLGAAVGIGTASFVSFNERQTVEQAALTLKNNFRAIQQRALSGQKDIEICKEGGLPAGDPLPLAGWCFSPQDDGGGNTSYLLYGSCGPDPLNSNQMQPFPDPDQGGIPERVGLPDGVEITNFVRDPDPPHAPVTDVGGTVLFLAGSNRVTISAVNPDQVPADPTDDFDYFNEIVYCLVSDLPTLSLPGADDVYEIRITEAGDIIDMGFGTQCPDPSVPVE
ncbi:MAG: type II secretion system GspH family protein [Candidatus Roizmanbacteria bacterium]|nr:type II secretion system GspH family protein [Candidatus Roizmanbacteria bacterium]